MKDSAVQAVDAFAGLFKADDLEPRSSHVTDWWTVAELTGRLVELSGGAARAGAEAARAAGSSVLTAACRLVLEAQRLRMPVAWVSMTRNTFYPPDMADNGVDLTALPVVWAPSLTAAGRAADWLLRSSAFGLLILDLRGRYSLPPAVQGRLLQLARTHRTALVCLTEEEGAALGSLVSLRARASWRRVGPFRLLWELRVFKDKRRGPGWKHTEVCRGPVGLC